MLSLEKVELFHFFQLAPPRSSPTVAPGQHIGQQVVSVVPRKFASPLQEQ